MRARATCKLTLLLVRWWRRARAAARLRRSQPNWSTWKSTKQRFALWSLLVVCTDRGSPFLEGSQHSSSNVHIMCYFSLSLSCVCVLREQRTHGHICAREESEKGAAATKQISATWICCLARICEVCPGTQSRRRAFLTSHEPTSFRVLFERVLLKTQTCIH